MNERAWEELAEDRERLQPTPPVGEVVIWYIGGDKRHPVPARVSGVESAGRVKLTVFPWSAFPQHKPGVYHVSARIHDKPGNPTTRNCGSWDYVRGKVPKEDYATHEAELDKRQANLKKAEEEAAGAALKYAEQRAKTEEGKKKRPDPLATIKM